MLNMGDAFESLTSDELDYSAVSSAKVFYTDLLPKEPAITGLKKARKAGVKTVFNMQVALAPCRDCMYQKRRYYQHLSSLIFLHRAAAACTS